MCSFVAAIYRDLGGKMQTINWPNEKNRLVKRYIKKILYRIRGQQNVEELVKRGMKCGKSFWCGDGCSFDNTFCYLIEIGDYVTLSSNVQLVTHDSSLHRIIGRTKLGKIVIGDRVFVGARTLILPGVCIGNDAVIAAGSVVTKNIPEGEVWGGNPAVKITDRKDLELKFVNSPMIENYIEKREVLIQVLEKKRICFIP